MNRLLTSVFVTILVASCSHPQRDPQENGAKQSESPPPTSEVANAIVPPKTAAEARRAVHAQAQALGLLKGQPCEWWSRLEGDGHQWHVEREPYSVAFEGIEGTFGDDEKVHGIVYGTLDDLRQKGECWRVQDLQGFFAVVAYLDAKSGKLVFLWYPPEG